MYQIPKALLFFSFFMPIFSYTIRDPLHHNFSKLLRAEPESHSERPPHIAPGKSAGRQDSEQHVPAQAAIEDLIESPKVPSWTIEDYGKRLETLKLFSGSVLLAKEGSRSSFIGLVKTVGCDLNLMNTVICDLIKNRWFYHRHSSTC